MGEYPLGGVIDGGGNPPLPETSVLVKGNRIAAANRPDLSDLSLGWPSRR